jgi:hypothetical protein
MTSTATSTPILEGGLATVKEAAKHLEAAGLAYTIGVTDGSTPGS